MGLIKDFEQFVIDKLDALAFRLRRRMCNHMNNEAKVELFPGLEYVRYYRVCLDCGLEWDE